LRSRIVQSVVILGEGRGVVNDYQSIFRAHHRLKLTSLRRIKCYNPKRALSQIHNAVIAEPININAIEVAVSSIKE